MDHLEATKAMVAAGLGMAVLPEWTIRAELASGTLVARPLGKAGLWRSWGLAMQDELSTPVAARAFVRMCADWLSRAFAA
jgi:LysR family transcriptional regulator for metE and metH